MQTKDLRICVLRVQGVYVELFTQHIHWLYLLHVCDSWMQVHGSIPWKWNLFCIRRKVNLGKFRWRIVWEHKEKWRFWGVCYDTCYFCEGWVIVWIYVFFYDSLPCCKALRFYSSAEGWWEKIWSFGDLQER